MHRLCTRAGQSDHAMPTVEMAMSETKPKFARSLVRRPLLAAVLAASAAAPPAPAIAAFDEFLKLQGVDEELTLTGFSVGIKNCTDGGDGGAASREAGSVHIQDLSITKVIDKSSPLIFQWTTSGKHFDNATLDVLNTSSPAGKGDVPYLTIKMQDVIITSLQYSAAASDSQVSESLSINYGQVQFIYNTQNSDAAASPVTTVVNCNSFRNGH